MRIKLCCPPTYKDERRDLPITHICIDSREVKPLDLFFPIKGKNFDGNSFIPEVKKKGGIIARTSLTEFASLYKNRLTSLKYTVAITGSVGKTTTKEFIKNILKEKYKVHATEGNFNNNIGLPLTILSAPAECEVLVLEMGMNRSSEISELSKCALPNLAVITNIGMAHIGNLGSREAIARAKLEVTDGLGEGTLLVPHGEPLLSGYAKRMTFSSKFCDADFYVNCNFPQNTDIFKGRNAFCSSSFSCAGGYLAHNLAAACAVGILLDLSPAELSRAVASIPKESTRYKISRLGDVFILDDSYNASPESVSEAIKLPEELGYKTRSAVIGNMRELGEYTEESHRKIGKLIAECGYRHLYLVGEYSHYTAEGALSAGFPLTNISINENAEEPEYTATQIKNNSIPGEIIIFKASHYESLGRIIKLLEK